MGPFTDHPHTAITQKINAIIENDLDPEIELLDLLDVITIQYSGAIEAARAIRKKLKYGATLKEQSNSLDLLNALVINGGKQLYELYNDRKLLERLSLSANDSSINIKLRKKIIALAVAWNEEFEGKRGYEGLVSLKRQMPLKKPKKKPVDRHNFMDDEAYHSEDDDEEDVSSSSSSQKPRGQTKNINQNKNQNQNLSERELNKKYKIPVIDLKKESPRIKLLIAEASSASTDLTNVLQRINRDKGETPADNKRATQLFDKNRTIRRKILRYLQVVNSEEYLGSLIHANEQLVDALQKYTQASQKHDVSDDDSDLSDYDSEESDLQSVTESLTDSIDRRFPKTTRAPPSIPSKTKSKIVDDDPFGDSNQVDESVEWK